MFGWHSVRNITTTDLAQKLRQRKALLLDVREPAEYRAGHIVGAKNVPLARIPNYTPPANTELFVICRSGARSKRACKLFDKQGFAVFNVQGGMLAWQGGLQHGN